MAEEDKIHIKLEIRRNKDSDELAIMTHFDSNAPNFFKDKEGYLWMPTVEEKDFINEAFELMPINKIKTSSEKTIFKPPEKKVLPEPPVSKKERESEKILSPFERKEEKKLVNLPPSEKTEERESFEAKEEEPKSNDLDTGVKEEDKEILIKADDHAIEAVLGKNEEKDKSIIEADEQTIIEKVLSQKKKGKSDKER